MSTSPLAPVFKVLRCNPSDPDPSIDTAAMGPQPGDPPGTQSVLSRYIATRDEALLVHVEGVSPTWFHARRLPLAFLAGVVDSLMNRSEQRVMAFRAAVHRVDASEGPLTVVGPKDEGAFKATRGEAGTLIAPASWAQEIADLYGTETVQEIGEIVLTASRLKRGARGPFGFWGGSAASH